MLKLRKWGRQMKQVLVPHNDNVQEISLLDVKDLYDRAYEEREQAIRAYEAAIALMKKAEEMDRAYREQLAATPYTMPERKAASF